MGEAERPQFSDIDVWGLTHIGRVRKTNQDHYFHGSLTRGVTIERTSLGEELVQSVQPERLASLGLVADGVGSSPGGEQAARAAVKALVREVSKRFHDAQYAEETDPEVFSRLLHDAALACHESLVKRAEQEPDRGRFATALTLSSACGHMRICYRSVTLGATCSRTVS